MKIARLVQGVAVILWGWHVDLLPLAIPMAVLLELRHFTVRRWDLGKTDFYRVADITSLLLVALAIYLFLTERASNFLVSLVQLTPLLFYPLVVSLSYSTSTKLPLDVLVYTLRKRPDPSQPEWDISSLYIGVCLVAMGANANASALFFPAVAMVIFWTLWPMRPKRYSNTICLLLASLVYAGGMFAHQGIHQLHLIIREKSVAWLADLMTGKDPFKTKTAIGSVGRLKQSDSILFRVDMSADYRLLLQEASYDFFSDNEWSVQHSSFAPLEKMGAFTWQVQESGRSDRLMTLYLEYADGKGLVPLPRGTTILRDFPAVEVKQSRYGTVQATGIMPATSFQISYDSSRGLNGNLRRVDKLLAAKSQELISAALPASLLEATTDSDRVSAIKHYFDDFKYTLFQPDESQDPIAHFLYNSKAGHCEYFATATVFMLRAAGIHARYAVGYSVQEFDPFTDLFVVRKRHAHAWAIAYLDGSWQVVDTTPSVWLEMEEEQASPLQPLLDLASNIRFKFKLWWQEQVIEDYTFWLYAVAALLLLILMGRIIRRRQVMMVKVDGRNTSAQRNFPGADSPFYLIEKQLTDQGLGRNRGEPSVPWLQRIQQRELLPLLHEHYALRFDPRGISAGRKTALAQAVDRWFVSR